jgi:hypothetical protein
MSRKEDLMLAMKGTGGESCWSTCDSLKAGPTGLEISIVFHFYHKVIPTGFGL